MTTPVPESQRWRARALECRAMADVLRGELARRQMLKAAADFDRIADEAREREITQGMSGLGHRVRQVYQTR